MHALLLSLLLSVSAFSQGPAGRDWNQALAAEPAKGWAPLIGLNLDNELTRDHFIASAVKSGLSPDELSQAPTYDEKAFFVEDALGADLAPLLQRADSRYLNQRARDAIRDLRASAPAETLAEIFDGQKIKSVFNGDAGTGRWQKDIRRQSWLAKRAAVVGYDLKAPRSYGKVDIEPTVHWRDITVLTHWNQARYPRKNSVDLAHISFMDMGSRRWAKRLRRYLALVRDGGWAVIAHTHAYDYIFDSDYGIGEPRQMVRDRLVEETLKSGPWKLAALYDKNTKPLDYPTTDWWQKFILLNKKNMRSLKAKGYDASNFVLVFQKGR